MDERYCQQHSYLVLTNFSSNIAIAMETMSITLSEHRDFMRHMFGRYKDKSCPSDPWPAWLLIVRETGNSLACLRNLLQ